LEFLTATVAPPVAVADELAGALLLELLVLPPQPAATMAIASVAPAMASHRLIEPPFCDRRRPFGRKTCIRLDRFPGRWGRQAKH
jgi:hypothetical protein